MLLHVLAFCLVSSSLLLTTNARAVQRSDDTNPSAFKGFAFEAQLKPKTNKYNDTNSLVTITNDHNLQYFGKVDVGGHNFTLAIDTGSSDLWVTGVPNLRISNTTDKTVNLTYGLGSAAGNISYTNVSFGDYHIENQAFVNATSREQEDDEGILGLGFIGLSKIARKIKDKSGLTVMANIFDQDPQRSRFLALALERTHDGEGTAGGVLSVGEYDPKYANVSDMPKYRVEPSDSNYWTIAMSGMTVNGKSFDLKSGVDGTKPGTAISVIDSGTSFAYIPSQAMDAIYGSIGGAIHVNTNDQDSWVVPCLGQANLSFTFGQDTFPINPMELTVPHTVSVGGKQYTVCLNSFHQSFPGKEKDFDFLLGDIFMRNVYSVFHFGNSSTKGGESKGASIQFLSRTNQDRDYRLFENRRKNSLKSRPPLYDISKLHADGSTDDGQHLDL